MKSIYSFFSFYVRSLEKEHDRWRDLALQLLGVEGEPKGASEEPIRSPGVRAPTESVQAQPMTHQQALGALTKESFQTSRGLAKELFDKAKANGGSDAVK